VLLKLANRRIHIAGSASPETPSETLAYAHNVISVLTEQLVKLGCNFIVPFGGEPKSGPTQSGPPITFDWTIAESIAHHLNGHVVENLILAVGTSKTYKQIPADRQPIYDHFRKTGQLWMNYLAPGWHSGAARRKRLAQAGDVLIAISGGEGVEHLAQEYAENGKPVIPLNIQLGSSSNDGSGGAARLFDLALAKPELFFQVRKELSPSVLLEGTRITERVTPPDAVAGAILQLLDALVPPRVFYVRLLNPDVAEYAAVETFFRNVADHVAKEMGFEPLQMGLGSNDFAWMNQAIFDSLHYSEAVLVDLTGLRPNCFMELGYALGNIQRVILTALDGTKIPFDPASIEAHFWRPSRPESVERELLKNHWIRNMNMPPLVKPRGFS
jgi:hypothetical protein